MDVILYHKTSKDILLVAQAVKKDLTMADVQRLRRRDLIGYCSPEEAEHFPDYQDPASVKEVRVPKKGHTLDPVAKSDESEGKTNRRKAVRKEEK